MQHKKISMTMTKESIVTGSIGTVAVPLDQFDDGL
jgi:hypothetical protein